MVAEAPFVKPLVDPEVGALLRKETRSRLPLARQILIYLNPFALFMDASRGPLRARERALSYNRAMRWMLVPYIRRWMAIAAALALMIAPAEAAAAQQAAFVVPMAAVAVGFCIAATVAAVTAVVYLLLGNAQTERR
jgi:hypothetical protein